MDFILLMENDCENQIFVHNSIVVWLSVLALILNSLKIISEYQKAKSDIKNCFIKK